MSFKFFLAPLVISFLVSITGEAACLNLMGTFREREVISGHVTNAVRTISSDCNFINYRLDDLDLQLKLGQMQRVSHGKDAYSEFKMVNLASEGLVIQQVFFKRGEKQYQFEMHFIKKTSGELFVIRTRLDYPEKISSNVTELIPAHI